MSNERLGVSAADLDDLDLAALDAFLAARAPALLGALSRDDVAVRLGLLTRVAPRVLPTLVGLYLFGKMPQSYFPEWGVVCSFSHGRTLLDPIERRVDLDGGLQALFDGARGFVAEMSGARAGEGGLGPAGRGPREAPEGAEYDEGVVREALINALVHRDLRKPSRVAVRMFADRLEVWSPGGPPEGVTDLEELGREGGLSAPRNPIAASAARVLGLGEQLGRGLTVMLHHGGASLERRLELRASPREVLVVIPSRWRRPHTAAELS